MNGEAKGTELATVVPPTYPSQMNLTPFSCASNEHVLCPLCFALLVLAEKGTLTPFLDPRRKATLTPFLPEKMNLTPLL